MPQDLERYRQASADNTLRRIGRSIRSPFDKVGQLTHSDYQSIVGKLPHHESEEAQVMTPGADYGKFYFLVDVDQVDNTDVIIV